MSKRIITLGTWNGKPIEWIVLKKESFGTLVFSKLALFSLYPSWKGTAGTWQYSSLREYLNGGFYNKAFSADEKKKIVNCFLKNPESTKDDVFLLSKEEAETLMTQDERTCGNGSFCNGHGCADCYKYSDIHSTCTYLRTIRSSSSMYRIHPNGTLDTISPNVLSIRPAIYIREE